MGFPCGCGIKSLIANLSLCLGEHSEKYLSTKVCRSELLDNDHAQFKIVAAHTLHEALR